MGWLDIALGVATGGLYTVGKAIYQAGNAAEDAGQAAEEAGMAIAVIGSTIQSVGQQLESILKETEELLTVQRLTPRSEADLWDEEKERLDSLRQEKTRLQTKLKEKGVSETGNFDFDFWDILTDFDNIIETFQLLGKLATVNQEIHDIFYQEPGIVSTGIYNAKEVLERLNTIEQPMVEDILASLDDNLDVSEEVLLEIKKLFVTKKKVPVSVTELSPSIQDQLEMIRVDKLYYEGLLSRKDTVTAQLGDILKVYPENKFNITAGSISVPKENIYSISVLDDVLSATNVFDIVSTGDPVKDDISIADGLDDKDNISIADGLDDKDISIGVGADEVVREIEGSINIWDAVKAVSADAGITGSIESSRPSVRKATVAGITTSSQTRSADVSKDAAVISAADIARIATSIRQSPGNSMSMVQPYGAKISASLSTKFDGYQRNYDLMKAQKAFYFRQTLKMEKKYELLSNEWEEEPGLIPKTLDELHGVLENVRTEEQPRIDLLLDNVNYILEEAKGTVSKVNDTMDSVKDALSIVDEAKETVSKVNDTIDSVKDALSIVDEAKETVSKANDTMDSVKNALSILDFDTKYLKLGGMVVGGLLVLDLFVGLIVLVRMALGL